MRYILLIIRFILSCIVAVIGGWSMGFCIIKLAGLLGLT